MAIFYIDLVNGSDAAAGTSWGTAWKTFTSGATAARIAPGDEIRVAQTSAPTSVGTATWTSGKVGNSITFASAPTKQIDTCKSGWVTMGAGSTVTNGQATAFMTYTTFGGTTKGALQWVTSATTNGCYKDLGSTQDFSAHQQISFWFRSSAAFDCSGSQDMVIELCSDAGATTVVNSLTFPNWSFAANMWYPIVIDFGGALSSNVRSVRFRTASNTSQTFYVDEIFASPANGLTLWSLIGLNDGDWHAIRCIRDAEVQLLAGFVPGTATGAVTFDTALDCSWMGTTQTATTYKLEPSRALLPASGPAATFGVNILEAGTTSAPYKYSGGWDTSTGEQTGVTFLDNVTHTSSSVGYNAVSTPNTVVQRIGVVRFASTFTNTGGLVFDDCTVVACGATQGNSNPSAGLFQGLVNLFGQSSLGFKSTSGCSGQGAPMFYYGNNNRHIPAVFGNSWGCTTIGTILPLTQWNKVVGTFGNIYPAPSGSNICISITGSMCLLTFGDLKMCVSNSSTNNTIVPMSVTGTSNIVKFGDVISSGTGGQWSGAGNVVYMNSFSGTGNLISTFSDGNTAYINSYSASGAVIGGGATNDRNVKMYLHNFNGVTDYFRVYVGDFTNATPGYFELEGDDVYTAGSKAVRFQGAGLGSTSAALGARFDLKLASAAAEANKLVTVTCRVKRNTSDVTAGIFIPGLARMVPGYTADISTSGSSTGSFELLTITFTPTANCVFDVNAYFIPNAASTPVVIWDTLTISQAA